MNRGSATLLWLSLVTSMLVACDRRRAWIVELGPPMQRIAVHSVSLDLTGGGPNISPRDLGELQPRLTSAFQARHISVAPQAADVVVHVQLFIGQRGSNGLAGREDAEVRARVGVTGPGQPMPFAVFDVMATSKYTDHQYYFGREVDLALGELASELAGYFARHANRPPN